MSQRMIQLNFKFNVSAAEYEAAVSPLAEGFAAAPGLLWKIWMINDAEKEAGGIYLFEDQASLQALLESELVAKVMQHPALSDFNAKQFDVLAKPSAVTRAPLKEMAPV